MFFAPSREAFRRRRTGGTGAPRSRPLRYHANMIARIEGTLVGIRPGHALVQSGGMTYDVLVPATDDSAISGHQGETVRFETIYYIESSPSGGHLIPRLIGFRTAEDRAFFELFTTVRGIGVRKALRALTLPLPMIADAIAREDLAFLATLPEIGKRTASLIVTELRGKVDRFVEMKPGAGATSTAAGPTDPATAAVRDAIAILTQLGEPSPLARQLVERARTADRTLDTADALVAAAFRLKELPE